MQFTEESLLDALGRAQHVLDANAAVFAAVNASGSRQTLDAMIVELGARAAEQDTNRRVAEAATQSRRSAQRTLLRREMRDIAVVARSEFPETPEFAAFRAPASQSSTQHLLAAAEAMATLAEPHAAVFLKAGLPATFIEELRTAAKEVADARSTGGDARSKRAGSTEGLKAAASRARRVLRILDSLVERATEGNAPLLEQWKSARRIQRGRGGRRTPPPVAGSSTSSTSSTSDNVSTTSANDAGTASATA